MKIHFTLILLTIAAYAPAAWAQCTTGVDTGGQCVPPDALDPPGDSNPHAQPQQSTVVWASRWGAIAIDASTNDMGASVNRANEEDAITQAMHDCGLRGSQHCKLEGTYRNQCAAIAWGPHHFGLAAASDLDTARSNAIENCAKSATDCKVLYSACSPPARVQ